MPRAGPEDDFTSPHFTFAEACEWSGIAEQRLRNWLSRGSITDIGERHPKLKVWFFSVRDICRLAIIGEITRLTGGNLPLADSASLVAMLRVPTFRFQTKWGTDLVIGIEPDGTVKFHIPEWGGELQVPKCRLDAKAASRIHDAAYIVVPIDSLLSDVFDRIHRGVAHD